MKLILNRLNEELIQFSSRLLSHPLVRQLRQKYVLLADKDKHLLQLLLLILIIIFLYRLVFSPAYTFFVSSNKNYEKQLENYQWILKQKPIITQLMKDNDSKREGSLLSVASSTAKNYQINFNRFEPLGDDRVRLRLENVNFNSLVSWLGELENDKGISASDISLDSSSPGFVSVRLILQG